MQHQASTWDRCFSSDKHSSSGNRGTKAAFFSMVEARGILRWLAGTPFPHGNGNQGLCSLFDKINAAGLHLVPYFEVYVLGCESTHSQKCDAPAHQARVCFLSTLGVLANEGAFLCSPLAHLRLCLPLLHPQLHLPPPPHIRQHLQLL